MSDKRNYNIFFHLHTVSGITITVGLFIIFFAGAFTLFREEIGEWEQSGKKTEVVEKHTKAEADYNKMILALEKEVPNAYGREFYGKLGLNSGKYSFYVSATADTTFDKKKNKDYQFETVANGKLASRAENYSFGELLYWLHFYYQLDRIGYYISGLVAFFFFFAIITGVIIHWKKTFNNFFVFRPKQKMKTVWTDAHTALGFIGLPFQFIYALTGSMFGLGILVALSSGAWIYDGDSEKMYSDVMNRKGEEFALGKKEVTTINYNELVKKTEKKWPNFEVHGFHISNYGSSSMTVEFYGEEHISSRFLGEGKVVYNGKGEQISTQKPGELSYYDSVWGSVRRLHYAQFGNIGTIGSYLLKTVYFILALMTCFVIATGVLIWMEARNKKNTSEKRRKYNNGVGLVYLSLCLSMLPVTAATFIFSKLLPETANRESVLNYTFFLSWLGVSIILYFLKSNYLVNKYTLLFGGIFGLIIPILNGIVSGTWFWSNYANGEYGVFSIDLIWLLIGMVCMWVFLKLKPKA